MDTDDQLMKELNDLTMEFEKDKDEREYALIILPPLDLFIKVWESGSGSTNRILDVLGQMIQVAQLMTTIDPEDTHSLQKMSDSVGIDMYVIGPHGDPEKKMDWMPDDKWAEHTREQARVFKATLGKYRVSVVWTGMRHRDPHGEAMLYECGVFDMDTLELVDGMFNTNSKLAAFHCFSAFSEKWKKIVEEGGQA